jgi:hypothetical protein
MKKVLTLAAVVCALGVTWAVAAPSAPQDTQTTPSHPHQGMGDMHGRMHGMMQKHAAQEGHAHGKGEMQGIEMMACDMSAHGAGKHGHWHSTPEK